MHKPTKIKKPSIKSHEPTQLNTYEHTQKRNTEPTASKQYTTKKTNPENQKKPYPHQQITYLLTKPYPNRPKSNQNPPKITKIKPPKNDK